MQEIQIQSVSRSAEANPGFSSKKHRPGMLKSDVIAEVVAFYPVLSDLPPELKIAFVNSSTLFLDELDAVIFDFSSPTQSYIMLTSGTIRVTRQGKRRELVLYRVCPGEACILTVCNIISETYFQAISTAETQVRGVAIPAALFKRMAEQSSTFSMYIFRSFSSQLSDLLDCINETTLMQLDGRLASLLISKGSVVQTTHSQLADELGSVREVISRILKNFETKGLVKLDRNQVQIIDQEALKKIARLW